jgi:hypothetical protein
MSGVRAPIISPQVEGYCNSAMLRAADGRPDLAVQDMSDARTAFANWSSGDHESSLERAILNSTVARASGLVAARVCLNMSHSGEDFTQMLAEPLEELSGAIPPLRLYTEGDDASQLKAMPGEKGPRHVAALVLGRTFLTQGVIGLAEQVVRGNTTIKQQPKFGAAGDYMGPYGSRGDRAIHARGSWTAELKNGHPLHAIIWGVRVFGYDCLGAGRRRTPEEYLLASILNTLKPRIISNSAGTAAS